MNQRQLNAEELVFVEYCKTMGHVCVTSTDQQDREEKIDFFVTPANSKTFKVGVKRLHPNALTAKEDILNVVVELKTRNGAHGWLFAGLDWMVFVHGQKLYMYRLNTLSEAVIQTPEPSFSPKKTSAFQGDQGEIIFVTAKVDKLVDLSSETI